MTRILIVDDVEANRDVLARRLRRDDIEVVMAVDGVEALEKLQEDSFSLVLLDIHMPRLDGFGVLKAMKADEFLSHVPVIVISALDDLDSVVRCIELGAEDYLTKPFNKVLLNARVNASVERKNVYDQELQNRTLMENYNRDLERRVQEQIEEIVSAHRASILAMSKLAESKDPETGAHLDRMREYCKVISVALKDNPRFSNIIDDKFIENIYAASPLHDIGKVGVPDNILLKPGKLTAEEWDIMKTHPLIGSHTLRAVDKNHPGNAFIEMGIEIAESHHEKWDGSGYPYGLKGDEIPLAARILALGDVYDALTSRRCYKEAFDAERSRSIIVEGGGSHFDPDVVQAFIDTEDQFISIRAEFHDEDEDILQQVQAKAG